MTEPAAKDCRRCGGDGIEHCADPLQCRGSYCDGSAHECPDCGGTGLA